MLNGVKPLLLVSDPPYGVEYDPSWRNQAGAAKTKRTGKVLTMIAQIGVRPGRCSPVTWLTFGTVRCMPGRLSKASRSAVS